MKALALLVALLFLVLPARAGETGITLERGDPPAIDTNRARLARTIYSHDFENLRDPETGRMLPGSAALNAENWPDFWEPIRAVGFPEYLIPTVRIVPDESGEIPGAYRDVANHVLTMGFDGTRVGIRTKTPVPIDPGLAYEYSLLLKDDGLAGARIRTGVEWMRIDPAATAVVRQDVVPDLVPGQLDWPVVPFSMLVNDPPPTANAARLFVIVDRDPASVGGAYHGSLAIDNIVLKPLPRITINAPRVAADSSERVIPVQYHGLLDNIPDSENPGYFKGRRYSRRVEITDVFGEPVNMRTRANAPIESGEDGMAVEEIPFPRDKYGVYYFNIRLYDAEGNLLTDVMRSVAVMLPEREKASLALHASKPVFGVNSGAVPDRILARPGLLRTILDRSGVKMTKIVPWRDSYTKDGENDAYYTALVDEIRHLRTAGIGVTGVVRPPAAMFAGGNLAASVSADPDRFNAILTEAGRHLGLFVDSWQWGGDNDPSFADIPAGPALDSLLSTLRDFAGGMPTIGTTLLAPGATAAFPTRPDVTQARLLELTPAGRLWPLASTVFPWLFEPYFARRGLIYPPENLSALAPLPAADKMEEEARLARRSGAWLSLEPPPARHQEPNAAAERVQLEEMMVRAVYAAIVSPDAVFLGSLFDPVHGMLRRDATGTSTLETMARPTYLATRILSDFLEGSDYLGQLWLLPPFEAHVFRKPGTDAGIIAIWHNDVRSERSLPRAEIAAGPAMDSVDWAGNRETVRNTIPVRRVPSFLTGIPASLLLTRMSMRIDPDIPMLAQNRRQSQSLEMVNHMSRQAPVLVRLRYAARMPDGSMENSWMVQPKEMRLNLPPFTPELAPGHIRFDVTPDSNSQIQDAAPGRVDKSGLKIAQAKVTFNTMPPADMTMFLPFRLLSDLDVDVEPLPRANDPNFVTLQLKLRWFPGPDERRRGAVKLTPYYMKRGQMKESAAFPVSVNALPATAMNDADAPFEAVELRIPRRPATQTWVGLDEVGGSRFYIADVTDFMAGE